MAKKKKTKSEKLQTELRRRGTMTHAQMVRFLLRGTGAQYSSKTRNYYDPMLYGREDRLGFLEQYCTKNRDGSYSVRSPA